MSKIISFRLNDDLARLLGERARSEGVSCGAYVRAVVGSFVDPKPGLNVARLNQVTEYSQAALAALVDHILGDKQHEIIAVTAQRLEQIHGQK